MDDSTRSARALLLGERIDVRRIPVESARFAHPLCFTADDGGTVMVFRYGVVVFYGVSAECEHRLLKRIRAAVTRPYAQQEEETVEIRIRADAREGVEGDHVVIQSDDLLRLLVVADVLASSTVLGYYEGSIQQTFDRVQPLAERMRASGIGRRHAKQLLGHVGDALISQQMMIGSAQVAESPEIVWEHPELEPLYLRLEDEYELKERWRSLKDKLDLVFRTAQTLLDLLQDRRSLRVEWYIVILIVIEIVISLYELFFRHGA